MADYFFSTNNTDNYLYLTPNGSGAAGNHPTTLNAGTSTNATYDPYELRVSTGTSGAGTITKLELVKFLEKAREWVLNNQTGLDALLKAASASTDIP